MESIRWKVQLLSVCSFSIFFSVFLSLSFHWSLRIEWPRYLPGNSIFVIFFYSYFFDERVFFGFFFFNISFECVFFWGGGGFTGQRRKQKRNGIQPATICPPLTHFFPSFICFFFVWVNVCTEREGGGAADPPPSQRPISNDGGWIKKKNKKRGTKKIKGKPRNGLEIDTHAQEKKPKNRTSAGQFNPQRGRARPPSRFPQRWGRDPQRGREGVSVCCFFFHWKVLRNRSSSYREEGPSISFESGVTTPAFGLGSRPRCAVNIWEKKHEKSGKVHRASVEERKETPGLSRTAVSFFCLINLNDYLFWRS